MRSQSSSSLEGLKQNMSTTVDNMEIGDVCSDKGNAFDFYGYKQSSTMISVSLALVCCTIHGAGNLNRSISPHPDAVYDDFSRSAKIFLPFSCASEKSPTM